MSPPAPAPAPLPASAVPRFQSGRAVAPARAPPPPPPPPRRAPHLRPAARRLSASPLQPLPPPECPHAESTACPSTEPQQGPGADTAPPDVPPRGSGDRAARRPPPLGARRPFAACSQTPRGPREPRFNGVRLGWAHAPAAAPTAVRAEPLPGRHRTPHPGPAGLSVAGATESPRAAPRCRSASRSVTLPAPPAPLRSETGVLEKEQLGAGPRPSPAGLRARPRSHAHHPPLKEVLWGFAAQRLSAPPGAQPPGPQRRDARGGAPPVPHATAHSPAQPSCVATRLGRRRARDLPAPRRRAQRCVMASVLWRPQIVAAGDEDSDEDGWDIGDVRCDEQALDEMLQEDKNEALKKALSCGDVSVIEELLNSGINVESSCQFEWTPLMYAAQQANFAVVRLLLDRGANACFEIDKFTVLMAACAACASEENILKTVELLLSRNVDPNVTCRRQMTPLMYAAIRGYPQVVALLVAHGSHINVQDVNGYSALMWAAQHGHKSVILKLLELGADKNLQTKDEKTAEELAKINNHLEIHSLLSLAASHLQGGYHETIKQETIYKLLTAVPDHSVGLYSTFHDTELFLHGLGLQYLIGLLKERDITLRQLLIMQKDELIQIGITNPEDQQKLLGAINELQLEEIRFEDLPEVIKLELSEDQFLKFLQKLNEECGKLTSPVQAMNKHFLKNSHKIVLQWVPTENVIEACKDLIFSIEVLREEVTKLKDLVEKHEQRDDPIRVKLPEKAATLGKRLVKMGVVTLLGFGCFFFLTKLVVKKNLTLGL
ncbi:ankyrin repeat, SAM and basic leucine zipper domain-containing protein 1 [Podargus strigoides]